MSDQREELDKANHIILQGTENYTIWRSYSLRELQQKNCDWAITRRAEPTRESVKDGVITLGFCTNRPDSISPLYSPHHQNQGALSLSKEGRGHHQELGGPQAPTSSRRQNRTRNVGKSETKIPTYLSNEHLTTYLGDH